MTHKHFSRITNLKMTRKLILVPVVVLALGLVCLRADTPQMSAADIKPGMVGVGRTVFDGTKVEEFKVHIIGVLSNVIGPRRNLILARLEGGPLANAGVIAGMSGSPVYIDGKLIGAVSYSLGQFSKEPIAGITPIAEMTDATTLGGPRPPGTRVNVDGPVTPDSLVAAFRKALDWNRPFADRPGGTELSGASTVGGVAGAELGTLLHPIATPLVMSGFDTDTSDLLASAFRGQGFLPMGASGPHGAPGEMAYHDGPLQPGDAVGVMMVTGDLQLGGTGTVTHVDGDHVYAFGHPLYDLGPIEFPMTRAYVYAVLPSLYSSIKLTGTGDVVGTILQDRATAIAGRIGTPPHMLPINLTLENDRGPKREFHFDVVNDQLFTPLMTFASLATTFNSYERQFGTATFTVKGKAVVKKHEAIEFENLFTGDQPSIGAATYIVAPIVSLMSNEYEKVDLERLDLTITSSEEAKTATLERVWIDDPRPRPGHTVPLKVLLRTYRGEEYLRTLPIDIPANASGTLSVMVSDGSRLSQIEQREARSPLQQPRSVSQMIRALNKARRNNTLYVKLLGPEAGAVVNGEQLPSLPPSVLGVIEADKNSGSVIPLHNGTLGEWELSTEQAVSGSRTLTISVSQN